ncbi:MAG: cytochrome c oxidase subunit II [Gemmatimonadota bacterium]|jgi:cytochrome c oxidase subunit 2
MNWSWLLPPAASTFAPDIDRMYYVILAITGVVFFVTEILLVWFLVRYRHREGRKAEYVHGNTTAEIVWTAVPFVIVLGIALASRGVWAEIKDPASVPPDAMEVLITAKQFEWNTTYPGADGVLETADDHTARNSLDIPVHRPVRVTLRSEDVIHSFFLPAMRVKQDVVPGMQNFVWFEATETGEFTIGCAELCGIGHTRMRGQLTVHTEDDYRRWLAEEQAGVSSNGAGAP